MAATGTTTTSFCYQDRGGRGRKEARGREGLWAEGTGILLRLYATTNTPRVNGPPSLSMTLKSSTGRTVSSTRKARKGFPSI